MLGHNLFTYCKSNPIIRYDPSGFISLMYSEGEGSLTKTEESIEYWEDYVTDNHNKALKAYDSNKKLQVVAKAELRFVENAVSGVIGGGTVGKLIISFLKLRMLKK